MTRGRKPLSPATIEGPQFATKLPEAMENHPVMSPQVSDAMEDALKLGRAIGRIEMNDAAQIFGNVAVLSAFDLAKQSKAYSLIKNPRTGQLFGSLEEFCEVALGRGYERLRQLVVNRRTVGQELFERTEKLGLRQVDYSAIKALPAPKQELVKTAIAEGSSREDVVQAVQEFAAQMQREAESAAKEVADLKAELAGKDKQLTAERAKTDHLAAQVERVRRTPPDEALKELRLTVIGEGIGIESAILNRLGPALKMLVAHPAEHLSQIEEPIKSTLIGIMRALSSAVVVEGMPREWLPSWEAVDALSPEAVARQAEVDAAVRARQDGMGKTPGITYTSAYGEVANQDQSPSAQQADAA